MLRFRSGYSLKLHEEFTNENQSTIFKNYETIHYPMNYYSIPIFFHLFSAKTKLRA